MSGTDRVKCNMCDNMILPATAKSNGGLCMPCKKKDAEFKSALPSVEDDLRCQTLGYLKVATGSCDSAERVLAYFHEKVQGRKSIYDPDVVLSKVNKSGEHTISRESAFDGLKANVILTVKSSSGQYMIEVSALGFVVVDLVRKFVSEETIIFIEFYQELVDCESGPLVSRRFDDL